MNEADNEKLCYIKLHNSLVGEERCEIKLKKTDTVKKFLQKLLLYTGLATSDSLSEIADADYEKKRLASGQKEKEKKENEEEEEKKEKKKENGEEDKDKIRLLRKDIIICKNQSGFYNKEALTYPDNYDKTLSDAGLWDRLSESVENNPVTFNYMIVGHLSTKYGLDWCDQRFISEIRDLEKLNSGLKELPYYEIVSSTDAANPSKKINSFKACDNKKMKCTIIPTTVKYGSLVPDMKATNPFHRFIFSDYLRKQKLEGRLSNAENIFNREIGGFDTMTEKANEGNIKDIPVAAMQKGWQGIDKKDYIQVRYNGKGWDGHAAECNDALAWYTVLDNVILDKAYLSFDSNLDILICDAQALFDKGKINFDQMQNIVLMLRYAYELRKLPNEKNGELNLNIEPINLNSKSKKIIDNMCTHLCTQLVRLLSDPEFGKKITDQISTMTDQISTMINENDEMRGMMKEAQGLGNEEFNKMASKCTPDLSLENVRVPVDNLVKIFHVYAELTKRMKELKNKYRSRLLEVLSSSVDSGRMKNIEAYDTEESDFIEKLKKWGNLAESLNLNQDPPLLELEEQINQKSNSLKKLGEIMKSSECQKIVEYLDSIRVCVNYVDGDLNLLQRFLNCLCSLFGLLDFQCFKIGVNFNNEKTIFAKYNARDAKAIVKANHDLVSDELGYRM